MHCHRRPVCARRTSGYHAFVISKATLSGRALVALAATLSAAGCSGGSDLSARQAAAADIATDLVAATEAGNGRLACELLTPDTRGEVEQESERPCAQGLLQKDLPPGGPVSRSEVFGRQAIVQLGEQTLFLSRVGSVWRVNAAGCAPRPLDMPYDCTVKGS